MQLLFSVLLFGIVSAFFEVQGGSSGSSSEEHNYGGGRGHHHHHGPVRGDDGGNNRGCERGWLRLDRPSGGWCVKVFSGGVAYDTAEAQCQQVGATLSGLQDDVETRKITAEAIKVMAPYQSGSFRIGAKRTARCARSGYTASCTPQNSFTWSDASITGTDGFNFNTLQPDNARYSQPCVVLLASTTPTVTDYQTWFRDRLDDVGCHADTAVHKPRAMRGYICGKRPKAN